MFGSVLEVTQAKTGIARMHGHAVGVLQTIFFRGSLIGV
jgi:hypothetical protein